MKKITLQKQISDAIASTSGVRQFAVFDFDNTCIVNDIAEATLNHMARFALFRDRTILPGAESLAKEELAKNIFDHYYGLLENNNVLGAYEFGAKTLGGFKISEIGALIATVIKEESEAIGKTELYGKKISKGLTARPAVIRLIEDLQKQGIKIWVISASPYLLVAEAMKHFGISAELIGIRHKIIDGVIMHELEYPLSVMSGKVDCIKLFIDSTVHPLLGAGDSMNDCPMLEYSNLKIVVNRGNSLSQRAQAEGWILIN